MTAPTDNIAVVSARLIPTDMLKVCMTNISSTPKAAAPPTGASQRSIARPEKRASSGNTAMIHIAERPGTATAALTPHRGLVLTVAGQAMAKRITTNERMTGAVSLGKLGRKTVMTASNVAAATVVEAEIVLRTLLSCHVNPAVRGRKTTARPTGCGTVSLVA